MKNRRAAFTLLEVILAVALCALIMSLIYGVVISTIHASEQIEQITQGSEVGPAILSLMREDLGAAFLPGKDQDYFVGQSRAGRDRLDFVSSSPVYAAESAGSEPKIHSVSEIGYQVKESREDGLVLYRRVDPFVDAEPLRGGRLIALAPVTSFKVTYFENGAWVDSWASSKHENQLPSSIKIELKMKLPDSAAKEGVAEKTFSTVIPLAH